MKFYNHESTIKKNLESLLRFTDNARRCSGCKGINFLSQQERRCNRSSVFETKIAVNNFIRQKMKALNNEASRVQISLYNNRIKIIQQVVANRFGITLKELQAHTRKGSSIQARKRVNFFCREFMPHCPLSIIGLLTGNGRAFDHAAVYHSAKNMEMELNLRHRDGKRVYPEVCDEIIELRLEIRKVIDFAKEDTHRCPTCGRFLKSES